MKALMKWLAKHGHALTEGQKVAAKEYVEAVKAANTHHSTKEFLQMASPKEVSYLETMYRPGMDKLVDRASKADDALISSLHGPEQMGDIGLYHELWGDLAKEASDTVRDRPLPGEGLLRYRSKKSLGEGPLPRVKKHYE